MSSALSLAGKTALVTGGTRGIGLAISRAFLELGARVMITGQTRESIAAAAAHFGSTERWSATALDLALPDSPARAVNAVLERFGAIDVLVNNAGVAGPSDLWDTDAAEWDRVQAVNLRAPFLCAREAARAMKAAGRGGAIISLSSVGAQLGGVATGTAYVASKAGVIGLTRSLARHFAAFGVRVNCIAPAAIETDMTQIWPGQLRERLLGLLPLSRFGKSEEVALAAAFLASDAASYITGQTLNINGGIYMG